MLGWPGMGFHLAWLALLLQLPFLVAAAVYVPLWLFSLGVVSLNLCDQGPFGSAGCAQSMQHTVDYRFVFISWLGSAK